MIRDVIIWTHFIVHFSADFCLDVKAKRANVWAPFIILIMVGWEAAPPQLGNVKIVPIFEIVCIGKLPFPFFSCQQQISKFFLKANINTYFSLREKWWLRGGVGGQFPRNLNWSIFLANVYFVYSSLDSSIQCSLVFVSFLSSLLSIGDDRSCNLLMNTYNDIIKDFWYWHYYWHSLRAVLFLLSCVLPGAICIK